MALISPTRRAGDGCALLAGGKAHATRNKVSLPLQRVTVRSLGSAHEPPSPWTQRANRLVSAQMRVGERDYVRMRDLPSLLHLFPGEIASLDRQSPYAIVRKLQRACRAERKRGVEGCWRYSLGRHIGLQQALAAEQKRLGSAGTKRRKAAPLRKA